MDEYGRKSIQQTSRQTYNAKNAEIQSTFLGHDPRSIRSKILWEFQRGGSAYLFDTSLKKKPSEGLQMQLRRGEVRERLTKVFIANARARSAPAAHSKWQKVANLVRIGNWTTGNALSSEKNTGGSKTNVERKKRGVWIFFTGIFCIDSIVCMF